MRKLAEKIAIVALICITFVFVLMAVLYAANVIPQKPIADNAVPIVVLSVLFAIYLGLSAYLLIMNFSELINIKRILLFYDVDSATYTNHKVIKTIVRGCAKEFPQLKLKRILLRVDDKLGLVANISVKSLVAEDIASYTPKLKTLLLESFKESLGLKFSSINFTVVNLSRKFTPSDTLVEMAKQTAAPTEAAAEEAPTADAPDVAAAATQEVVENKQDDIAAGEEKTLQNT